MVNLLNKPFLTVGCVFVTWSAGLCRMVSCGCCLTDGESSFDDLRVPAFLRTSSKSMFIPPNDTATKV